MLTGLQHRAYSAHIARGATFLAAIHPEALTEKRAHAGRCFIAEAEGAVIGTLTVRPPKSDSPVVAFRGDGDWFSAKMPPSLTDLIALHLGIISPRGPKFGFAPGSGVRQCSQLLRSLTSTIPSPSPT